MRKQVVAAAQVFTQSSPVGSAGWTVVLPIWGGPVLGELGLESHRDTSRSLQHLGGCAGDKNSEDPSSAGYPELSRSVLSRGGGGGQGEGRVQEEEDRTAAPAWREQVAEFFLCSSSPVHRGLCCVPGCPGRGTGPQ